MCIYIYIDVITCVYTYIYIYIYIHIHIHIERERDIHTHVYIYIDVPEAERVSREGGGTRLSWRFRPPAREGAALALEKRAPKKRVPCARSLDCCFLSLFVLS